MDKQTFKTHAISEALGVSNKSNCCRLAYLSAMLKTVGAIEVSRKGAQAMFSSDNSEIIASIAKEIKVLYLTEIEIERSKYTSGAKRGSQRYELRVPKGQTKQLLQDTCAMTVDGEDFTGFVSGISQKLVEYVCCAQTFVRGLFIGCGNIYVPSTSDDEETKKSEGYHLEFQFNDEETAADLVKLLATLGINAKSNVWGVSYLVYLKEKNAIMHLFQILNMPETTLKLQEIMKERELRGSINRTVICEAANLDKSYIASVEQLQSIQIIEKRDGLSSLSPLLRETALARIANPRQTLQELAEILGITKSCLNHRMRKILQLAKDNTI
ncbi:MAG TPA: DNA-binding protein WhiA [Clostridia bacterium]|nr:DNA-binding protein WhiA [Clostridia bacterium]